MTLFSVVLVPKKNEDEAFFNQILRSFGASDPFLHPEVHLEFFVQSKIFPSCPRDLILAFFLCIFLSSHKNMFISNPETGVSLASWEYNFTLREFPSVNFAC